MASALKRRDLLTASSALVAGGLLTVSSGKSAVGGMQPADLPALPELDARAPGDQFLFGLNTSTIRGQKPSIVEEIAIAARAGYRGMEPWMDELERYVGSGGSPEELGKRFRDAGIAVESAIGFFEWIVDDASRRRKGLEAARRSMDLLRRIGGKRLAAPPVGATDRPMSDLVKVAERYRALLELGDKLDVVPQVEVWGSSRTLSRLSEAAFVAIEAAHPKACILPDVYHLYRGGSNFDGVKLLGPSAIHVFHFNDYPAKPPRERLTDAQRVYPGDGVAPLRPLLEHLAAGGFRVMLSLELFNRAYWAQDPFTVAKTGLEKMKAVLEGARTGSRP
jgi:sugar phosphate isomerase/epimerase